MFKHLLVPLDGSRLAEAALPAAALLAEKLGARVTLLHLIERDAPPVIHGERHLVQPEEAGAYLREVATRAFPLGAPVECHVHTGDHAAVADGIVSHAREMGVDLIALCTHGTGGLRRLLAGSIAQRVVAQESTPVLLIRPEGHDSPPPAQWHHLLVPLDGTGEHAQGLEAAAELAGALSAALHLVAVVPTLSTLPGEQAATGVLLPGATRAVLDLAEQSAQEYLDRQLARLRARGLEASAEVCRGDAVAGIVRAARRIGADVVVLGTHGKAGMDAFWSGSIAPRISSRTRLPLLLVPIPEEA